MPNATERTTRATAMSMPMATPVYVKARMLMAGPTNRKVMAGPRPAPRFQMPANSGRMVHEHTARTKPPIAEAG